MDLSELLNSSMGETIVRSVANQLGLKENEASNAVGAALPLILAGMTKNAQSKAGAESLDKALAGKHDGSLLNNLSGMLQGHAQELQQDGDGILGHVFGTNRKALEQGVARQAGISSDKAGTLLSTLAPIVMAYLGKEKRQTNTGAGGLGDLLSGLTGAKQGKPGGGLMDILGSTLDKDGDGNPLNDILSGFLGKR